MGGGASDHNVFNTEAVSWAGAPAQTTFLMPPCPVRPLDTQFCASHPGTAPAWWTVCLLSRTDLPATCVDSIAATLKNGPSEHSFHTCHTSGEDREMGPIVLLT